MYQVKTVVFTNLFFLFITSDNFRIVFVLRAVQLYCQNRLFLSAETFFIDYKIKAAFVEKIAVIFIFVK